MLLKPRHFIATSVCLLLAVASARAATLPEACGDDAVQYKVKTQKGKPFQAPASGSSQLLVIHTLAGDDWNGSPIARIAVDGKWVGAAKSRSYFAVDITPGPHMVCISRQSGARSEKENVSVEKISVQSGQVTYLNFTLTRSELDDTKTHPAGQLLGYASPDMTAKRHETSDGASLSELGPEAALARLRGLPESVPEPK